MKKEIFEFEKRIESALKHPENDPGLFYPEKIKREYYDWVKKSKSIEYVYGRSIVHWENYIDRLFKYYGLTANETKTAYLYYGIYENNKDSKYFANEFHRVYDGINVIPMSDEELEERISLNEGDYDYLHRVTEAYLQGKPNI